MKTKLLMAVATAATLCSLSSAQALTVWTEGKRTTTASGISGQAAVLYNRDVGTFDAGALTGGDLVFVGRALGTGFDAWIFDASKAFSLNVDWFAPSSRNGGPDIGANLVLDRMTPVAGLVSSTAMPSATGGFFAAGQYKVTVQSTRPDAFDYDVRVSIVPVPLAGGLLLTGLAALGFVGRRRLPTTDRPV